MDDYEGSFTQFVAKRGGVPLVAKPKFPGEVDHLRMAQLWNDWRNG